MPFEEVGPGLPYETGGSGEPTESEWFPIGDRCYKVFALPRSMPTFVLRWCDGGLIMSLVGFAIMTFVTRNDAVWGARIYWQRKRWYNGPYHRLLQEEFEAEADAKARAREFIESVKAGQVPAAAV